jgi:putative ABC transport system permease protein
MTEEKFQESDISPLRLVFSTAGLLILLIVSSYLKLDIERKIFVGIIRSSAQLLFLGYFLLNILFSLRSLPLIFLYLFIMIALAALESVSRQQRTYERHYWDAFRGCLLGGGTVGLYGTFVIFSPTPWWSPKVMIPTCGMIIGNSVSGPAVAVERLLSEVSEKSYELETRLSFGSTYYESVLPIVRTSILAALTPTLNQLAIMGLVSIPGMMTGQLLGGSPPLTAAEYQMAILYLIVATSSITTIISLSLAVKNAVFDMNEHRLTLNKITKTMKAEIDVVLVGLIRSLCSQILSFFVILRQRIFPTSSSSVEAQYNPVNSHDLESHEPFHKNHGEDDHHHIEMVSSVLITKSASFLATYEITENNSRSLARKGDSELLRLVQLNVKSGESNTLFAANESLDIKIYQSEIVTIEGRSGLGKTRLLKAIAALDLPHQGYCCYKQNVMHTAVKRPENSTELSGGQLFWKIPKWRTHVVYISQVKLFSRISSTTNVMLVLGTSSFRGKSERISFRMFKLWNEEIHNSFG